MAIVEGLFGLTPEMYQREQSALADARALQYAKLDPFQQANFAIGRGANQLAGAIGGALGGTDPELQRITRRQQIASQVNLTDPDSIQQGYAMLQQVGDTEGMQQLAQIYRQQQESGALISQRQAAAQASVASANKETRSAVPNDIQVAQYRASLQNTIENLKSQPQSPELAAAIQQYETQLAALPVKVQDTTPEIKNAAAIAATKGEAGSDAYKAEYSRQLLKLTDKESKANIKEIGVAAGSNAPVYLDANTDLQYIYGKDASGKQIRIPYFGGVDRTTSKTNVNVTNKGEVEFEKELGTLDAKAVGKARETRDSAIASLNTLNRLNQLDQNGLISGTYATGRVGATNLLATLGLASGKDIDRLANSENYAKAAGDLVLSALGGKLGAGFSNEDRSFIAGLVPQLENSPQARKQLIEFMTAKNKAIVDETTRMESYARTNKSLGGYVPTIPAVPTGGLSSMTNEQLREEIRKKKAGK